MIYLLGSPYMLASNATINSGSTNNYTCTGVGGVPSGALGVWLNIFYTPSAAGTSCEVTPHGTSWAAGQYPLVGSAANGTNVVCGQILTALDGSGKIDVHAASGNLVGIYIGMFAYFM